MEMDGVEAAHFCGTLRGDFSPHATQAGGTEVELLQ
jgi:hypothetical protein